MGLAAGSVPTVRAKADGVGGPGNGAKSYHKGKVGGLDVLFLSDGSASLGPIAPLFAPAGDETAVNALLKAQFRPLNAIALGLNILVVKKAGRVILVDCGAGNGFGAGAGWLVNSLAAAGISQQQVTDIVLTHAHTDHIGGLINARNELTFRNADIHISEAEYAFWMADHQDFSKCMFPDKSALTNMASAAKKILTASHAKINRYHSDQHFFDCIKFQASPGHTPGHHLVIVYDGNEKLVHLGDLVHSDILAFEHPEWGSCGDTDLHQAVDTRRQVLTELAGSGDLAMGYHLPWPGMGRVKKTDTGFQWIPAVFAYPG